jgi:lysophospholipase L1-like esterase
MEKLQSNMQKNIVIAISLVCAAILGFFLFAGSTDIKNYPPGQGPIVAFGDSLVFGYGATTENDFVSVLSRAVGEPIINLGVSGNTTADGLARIDQVIAQKPRITLVLLGGNDFLRKVDRTQTFSNLRTIVTKIQDSGSVVVLLGVRGGLIIDSADGLYEDLAKETGSAYVSNVLEGLFGDARYMADAIHPNDVGYTKVAEKVYPVLSKVLK